MSIKSPECVGERKGYGPLFGREMVEISLLLPGWQASALEDEAFRHGLSAAEMVRRLIRDHIARGADLGPDQADPREAAVEW